MARKALSEIKVDFILLIDIDINMSLLCISALDLCCVYWWLHFYFFRLVYSYTYDCFAMFVAVVILLYVPIYISLFHVYSYLCDGWGDGWFQRKKSVQLHLQNVWLYRLQFHRYKRFQDLRIQTLSLININSLDAQDMNGLKKKTNKHKNTKIQHKMMKIHIVLIDGLCIFSHHGCEVQEYIRPVYRSVRLLSSCGGGEWLLPCVIRFQGR